MAFDFPASPTNGQVFTSGGVSYVWNGYGWVQQGAAGTADKAYVDSQDALKVAKLGDVMTGPLHATLFTAPANSDSVIGDLTVARVANPNSGALHFGSGKSTYFSYDTGVLSLVGSTLSLPGNPTLGPHAATKSYVDTVGALKADKTYVDTQDALKADKTYVDTQDGARVLKTGDTMSGTLTINSYAGAGGTRGGHITFGNVGGHNIHYDGTQYLFSGGALSVLDGSVISLQTFSSTVSNVVLASGTAPGAVYLRPNGPANAAGEFIINNSGAAHAIGDISSDVSVHFVDGPSSQFYAAAVGGYKRINWDTGYYIRAVGTNPFAVFVGGTEIWNFVAGGGTNLFVGTAYKPGGGTFGDNSDARIKTVNGTYDNGLEAILTLRPIRYVFKGNETTNGAVPSNNSDGATKEDEVASVPYANSPHHDAATKGIEFIGLIAQECEEAFPEMVGKRSAVVDGVEVNDLRTLDTSPLIFALVNAVKTLAARVAELEARVG